MNKRRFQQVLLVAALFLINAGVLLWLQGNPIPTARAGQLAQDAPDSAADLLVTGSAAPASVPGVFNYQGIVRDADGNPLVSAEHTMTFRIYDGVSSSDNMLWEEVHNGVSVREGRFGATMGYTETIPSTLFAESKDRFVGVTVEGFPEMQPRLRLASVPYAFHAENAFDGVPVGGIIDWWRPDSSYDIPDGYLVCDGATVNDPDSPLNGKVLPNLADVFIRGVSNPAAIGTQGYTIGGSDSHNHAMNAHNHTASTETSGDHYHKIAEFYHRPGQGTTSVTRYQDGNGVPYSDTVNFNASGLDITVVADFTPFAVRNSGFLYDNAENVPKTILTHNNGNHSHPVTVADATSTSQSANSVPRYVGLLKLCRIR